MVGGKQGFGVGLVSVACGGGIGAEFFAVFGEGVCQGITFWSGSGGGGGFLLVKNRVGT